MSIAFFDNLCAAFFIFSSSRLRSIDRAVRLFIFFFLFSKGNRQYFNFQLFLDKMCYFLWSDIVLSKSNKWSSINKSICEYHMVRLKIANVRDCKSKNATGELFSCSISNYLMLLESGLVILMLCHLLNAKIIEYVSGVSCLLCPSMNYQALKDFSMKIFKLVWKQLRKLCGVIDFKASSIVLKEVWTSN